MKYIKKPVEIEAIQFTRNNWDEIRSFTNDTAHTLRIEKRIDGIATCIIPTLEGKHIAHEGDWIIKGVKGEFYPCKPDTFEMTYEPVVQKDIDEKYGIASTSFEVDFEKWLRRTYNLGDNEQD